MDWVLDCSLALAWVLPDEGAPRADRFLAQLSADTTLWVPALWWYELANALTMAHRRRRLAEADRIQALALYAKLPLRTDAALGAGTVERFQALAREHTLSAYDAAYLELAQRRGVGLASLDRDLLDAARRSGLRTVRA